MELVLLNDVVIRFRRDVMTRGRLRNVAKAVAEDCDLIDRLMTKYSVYEHPQADDLPQILVELDEFERDVLELIYGWRSSKFETFDCQIQSERQQSATTYDFIAKKGPDLFFDK